MSNKTCGILALTSLLGLSAFLLNCGTSNSRPSGVLFVASQGASNVGSYAINLGNGSLSLINANASTCSTLTQTPPVPCGFPVALVLAPAGSVAFVLNQGAFSAGNPPTVPPSGVVPSIYGYTVKSNGTLTLTGDLTSSPNPPTFDACDSPPRGAFTPCDQAVGMARDPAGKFLFVITQGNQNLAPPLAPLPPKLIVFAAQSGSTSLSVAATVSLTKVPTSVAAITDPKGNTLLYVTNNKDLQGTIDNTLSQYTVDSTGALTLHEANGPYVTASVPNAVLAVSTTPTGATGGVFIYVTNATPNNTANIFQLCTAITVACPQQSDIDNFFLNPVPAVAIGGTNPVALTVDPTNNFLYIVDHDSSDVRGFRINPTTGALSTLTPPSMSTGLGPVALTMHSSGKFLFVSNNGASSISAFNVDTTTGALSLPTNVTSSAQPYGLVAK